MHPSVAPIVGAFPTAAVIAQEAVAGGTDWATYASQLGVGAVLVAFAVWLQDRMAKERKAEIAALRKEMADLRTAHANDMREERDRHEHTRQLLIAALTKEAPR